MLRVLPDAPDGCTPGQLMIAAAVLTEAAEARTREAEACTICPAWPGLRATCQLLTGDAVTYRELAAELSGEVSPWLSTLPARPETAAVAPRGAGRDRAALAADLDRCGR